MINDDGELSVQNTVKYLGNKNNLRTMFAKQAAKSLTKDAERN